MGAEWRRLRELAPRIDACLKGEPDHGNMAGDGASGQAHRTLVHGDFKTANLLFSEDHEVRICA